ncbi:MULTISPECIES: hypothetical protein [Salinivibrio]|uniref:Uncharacterized protein n=2 Tax=Salinivibrio TaxID=51366 RepID=A0ABY7LFB6_9GAMM|nr:MULTISPECIES: hypothetical protein [Salinivibrio]ODP97821.1 hypothetical protein BGK46_12755 [Salinivibrio sp. DV]OOF09733.1 hypothetical protein BZG82_09985 [Salinivibrio sp. PR5]OOF13354.1 hypothetical protein BZG83_08830 [Salinivibrio sp. PR919]OOF14614.1 hypothetical protein BZG84_13880 [Salinivibrio sp. PR932]OOF20901.1 hypothetical protein BZJ17_11010 [Salinivibrio sp. IB574]
MSIRSRSYTLNTTPARKAHVRVVPNGNVLIQIANEKKPHLAEFDEVKFERKGKITQLVAEHVEPGRRENWALPMHHDDANELASLIDQAQEELEILMRDLS